MSDMTHYVGDDCVPAHVGRIAGSGAVAARLYELLGEPRFSQIGEFLRDVANEHALDVDGKVISPSVAWLAEAVTFYEPPMTLSQRHQLHYRSCNCLAGSDKCCVASCPCHDLTSAVYCDYCGWREPDQHLGTCPTQITRPEFRPNTTSGSVEEGHGE